MTDKQFRFARTSQCYCLGQRENACSKANCTQIISSRSGGPSGSTTSSLRGTAPCLRGTGLRDGVGVLCPVLARTFRLTLSRALGGNASLTGIL